MNIPFTVEQFLNVFETYNTAIWPSQIAAYILGIIAVALVFRKRKYSAIFISIILAVFWIWMGVFYHIIHFSAINQAAMLFGILFVLQGILFLFSGVFFRKLSFTFSKNPAGIIGLVFIVYAMLLYPLLNYVFGHSYPHAPMFGVAPCPTTIFTFGMLLLSDTHVPKHILVIPFLWSLIGMSAAVNLGIIEDFGLIIAGIASTALIVLRNRKLKQSAEEPH